ncbi:MAG: hypothetical protein N3A65_05165 [candidate division WOR-3 bacterium]|nr:hypothetical protein [candidate division WOR-3 bacterium]
MRFYIQIIRTSRKKTYDTGVYLSRNCIDEILKENCKNLLELLNRRTESIRNNKKDIHPEFGRFTLADIQKIIQDAALEAHSQNRKMTLTDIEQQIENTYPSVTDETLKAMEKFKHSHPNWKDASTGKGYH